MQLLEQLFMAVVDGQCHSLKYPPYYYNLSPGLIHAVSPGLVYGTL